MIENIIHFTNSIVWSPALLVLLIFAGLFFTFRTRFVQVRRIGLMARLLFSPKSGKSETTGISSFEAFCVALSGRVGTGNIIGVATAIAFGGPGAVFWMWVVAFFGAATAFMESTLAQIYKKPHVKGWRGGPSNYIEEGLGQRWLAILFALFTILGYGLLLVSVQSNGAASAFHNCMNIDPVYTACGFILLLGLVIIGGVKRISQVAALVTPFMAVGYVIMALFVIIGNWEKIPSIFASIFNNALGINPICGGLVGSAISMGVKRGLFSNEAGEGGGAYVSASADVDHPAKQGLVQAFSVYIDTLLVCTATALMILSSGTYNIFDKNGEMIVSNAPELGNNYTGFTQAAIDTTFTGYGGIFVAVALAFFVFTTMMAYYVYSESAIIYLCGKSKKMSRKKENMVIWIYRILMFSMVFIGSVKETELVWEMGDIGVGITTWVNVIALLILCPQALKALSDYEKTLPQKRK